MKTPSPWLLRRSPRPAAAVRLLCLPNAGGGASSYLPWTAQVPDFVEVVPLQLPGRENRLAEPPIESLDELVAQLTRELAAQDDLPYALFGHSMGAAVAYRVAVVVAALGLPRPLHLFVSSYRAPHLPEREPALTRMEQPELLDTLTQMGGLPAELLAHPEYIRLLLPTIRADLRVIAGIADRVGPPLSCPISVFGGRSDQQVSLAELQAWREHTRATCRVRTYEGGHFYLQDHVRALLAVIADELALAVALARGRPIG